MTRSKPVTARTSAATASQNACTVVGALHMADHRLHQRQRIFRRGFAPRIEFQHHQAGRTDATTTSTVVSPSGGVSVKACSGRVEAPVRVEQQRSCLRSDRRPSSRSTWVPGKDSAAAPKQGRRCRRRRGRSAGRRRQREQRAVRLDRPGHMDRLAVASGQLARIDRNRDLQFHRIVNTRFASHCLLNFPCPGVGGPDV